MYTGMRRYSILKNYFSFSKDPVVKVGFFQDGSTGLWAYWRIIICFVTDEVIPKDKCMILYLINGG